MERTLEEIIEEQKREVIEHAEEGTLYDYIASNYWRIEDEILINTLKEYIYIEETRGDENKQGDKAELIENLKEYL